MADKGYSQRDALGGYKHYDSEGRKTGSSRPGVFGGYSHYDANGGKTGRSSPDGFGGYTHYDNKGHKTGSSRQGGLGAYSHYDAGGKKVGGSNPGVFGSYHHNDAGGCYVATCVYGSYDCPQVWTLRRFRDDTLAMSAWGRAFIRAYYAVSPTIVRWFGGARWFRRFWRGRLDAWVRHLQSQGVADTPYQDRPWK